ncbi:MAG TPA: UPF0280 family protein [Amaricoccus sp.]|nr:UPF0280 family protein [Amaricoccus sp.]
MSGAQAHWLPDRRRLHLHHGPIDLVLQAWADPPARAAAYAAAHARFQTILAELTAELTALRSPAPHAFRSPVARAMAAAVGPHRPAFITPMAAVAGAVADEILARMTASAPLARAYVNDGGDIALHLRPGETLTATIAGTGARTTIAHADPVRGIATSGWRGRSFSLGIADAVTVLARTAAQADAAATMIANAVDLPGHPAVTRAPANSLQHDTDLGARSVTTAVAPLAPADIARALDSGLAAATAMRTRGLIVAAALFLQGEARTTGPLPPTTRETEIAHA